MSNTSVSATEHAMRQGVISDDHMAREQLAEPGADMTDAQYQAGWNDAIDAVMNGAFGAQLQSNAHRRGMLVVGKNYAGVACVLVNEATGAPVLVGEPVRSFRGEVARVDDGTPPHKSSSTGRVVVAGVGGEFGPTVYGLKWVSSDVVGPVTWEVLGGVAQASRGGKPFGSTWAMAGGGWVGWKWASPGGQAFETEAEARAFVEGP